MNAAPIDAVIQAMCRYLARHAETPLPLSALARKSGYSAGHLQRRFKAVTGSSPKAYQAALRQRQLKHRLKSRERVAAAIYGAGYGSPSRVYEHLERTLGMTPKQYREGGRGLVIRYATAQTPLGRLLLGATERGLCFLQVAYGAAAPAARLRAEFPHAVIEPMATSQQPRFAAWMRALKAYLAGRAKTLALPLDLRGTAFQIAVWNYLQTIPPGTTRSYREVAAAIGRPKAIRAVASACARNKVCLAVPCHRVIHSNGDVSGYRWGIARKRALLARERA